MEEKNNNIVPVNEDLNAIKYETENIKNLIYTIRGKQVMLDSDVAMLYQYTTKSINKAMKRNINRFPEDFCFQLTEKEVENLRFQFGTSSLKKENYGGRRYLPYVYTEQGISMLAGVLKNEIAVQVSINIIRAFIEMRKFISLNGKLFKRLTNVECKILEHDKKFDIVFNELQKDEKMEFKQKILIIDNYIDDSILKMLSKKNQKVEVVILTLQNSKLNKLDITKFNKQYPVLKLAYTNKFHDRFIVIDNKELYYVGASLKDLGKKCFAISKIEDKEYLKRISNYN